MALNLGPGWASWYKPVTKVNEMLFLSNQKHFWVNQTKSVQQDSGWLRVQGKEGEKGIGGSENQAMEQ